MSHNLKDYKNAEAFYLFCSASAKKLESGSQMAQAYDGLIDLYWDQKKFQAVEDLCAELLESEAKGKEMNAAMGNYIDVGYNVEYADEDLISINFGEDTFTGGAHGNHNTFTLTYDLKGGRELKLADLFKPRAKYLTTIADYAIHDLKGRKDPESGENMGLAQDIFEDGAKPTAENYQNWNVTKKGLMITFPPYQVAAYAYGPQTVIVPLSKLKGIVISNGPLAKAKM